MYNAPKSVGCSTVHQAYVVFNNIRILIQDKNVIEFFRWIKRANGENFCKQTNKLEQQIFQKYQVMLGKFTNLCESKFNKDRDTHLL